LRAALLTLLLSACNGLDVTQAIGIPDPPGTGATPPEPVAVVPEPDRETPSAPMPEVAATPAPPPRDTTAATAANTDPIVSTPAAPVDAGVPPEPVVAFDCSTVPEAPVAFEVLEGFTSSEDFVFDELGNYVGVDPDNNLVRIAKTGERQLWAPAIGGTAGMAALPDGSVVFCDVGEGAVKRVYPNGSVEVLLGGLAYPNGLDVGPDGFIYVAENSGGRVRRIDPDTGEFSVVAMGLTGPNGVAFSDDPSLLYIGSFDGSGVYKLELGAPGELGRASVFARPGASALPEPLIACPDQQEGLDCVSNYVISGRCQALANVVDCLPVDPCPGLADGDYCDFPAQGGVCEAGRCEPYRDPCEGKSAGDVCDDAYYGAGVCEDYDTFLYCTVPSVCAGLSEGAACQDPFFGAGVCYAFDTELYCQPPNVCDGLTDGAPCEDPYIPGGGVCTAYEDQLYCQAPNVCDGLSEGARCEDMYTIDGVCTAYEDQLYCSTPNVCDGLSEGARCEDPYAGAGICQEGFCYATSWSGGIDGIGVDVCGNVYATEYTVGKIWRISPVGEVELLAELPSFWIPNVKWGRDLGGFSSQTMYVADRDEGRLFAVSVGVPGVTEFYGVVP
jgi:sugar lactone lactonase YvrE